MIPQPTGIRWRLSGTSPSLGVRRLNSLDPFLSESFFFQHNVTQLTNFVYESAKEHRKNYAAINAQLHLINERLRSSDSVVYGSSSSMATNMKIQKDLLRCISRDKGKW